MRKTVRKAFLLGLGTAALTKERVEKFAKELVKQGKISRKEGKVLVKSMVKDTELHRKRLHSMVQKETTATVKRLSLVSKREAKILAKRIAKLERELRKKPKIKKVTKRKARKRKKPRRKKKR